jgi:ubiquinol-cytochrome c reductase cytochrome b subunit
VTLLRRIGCWFFDRLGLEAPLRLIREHRVPAEAAGRKGWMYVFGTATLTAFLLQVVTGIALSSLYIPSPAHAHESLEFITREARFGALLRALHFFGASAMVVLITLHVIRVFLTGSFKFPREMNWITGVLLLVLTMAMAFTGQLLRWDHNGVWTVLVATKWVARVPFIGGGLAEFMLAGDTVGGATLTRFFSLHVLVFPLLIAGLVAVHLFLVLHHGISEPPRAGEKVDPATYRERYRKLKQAGPRYIPYMAWREAVVGFVVVLAVLTLALLFGPKGPGTPPDPTAVFVDPRPDWFFRWYYALIWYKPRPAADLTMVWLPLLALLAMLALPLLFNRGERSPARRPWAVLTVAIALIFFGSLTYLGMRPYWVPNFTTEPLSAEVLGASEGPVVEGARVFAARGCHYCHQVAGHGGDYGPDLTDVTRRMSAQEVTVRIVAGIKNMPSYRDVLSDEELAAIMVFLRAVGDAR